jgi:hypothetical protein
MRARHPRGQQGRQLSSPPTEEEQGAVSVGARRSRCRKLEATILALIAKKEIAHCEMTLGKTAILRMNLFA